MTADLRALLAAATPGPRSVSGKDPLHGDRSYLVVDGDQGVAFDGRHHLATMWGGGGVPAQTNAALIVAAVNALPGLLDERDRLLADLAEACRIIADLVEYDTDPVVEEARAFLAKHEGAPDA